MLPSVLCHVLLSAVQTHKGFHLDVFCDTPCLPFVPLSASRTAVPFVCILSGMFHIAAPFCEQYRVLVLLFCVLAQMLTGFNQHEIIDFIVRRIFVSVMNVKTFRNLAVIVFPDCDVHALATS